MVSKPFIYSQFQTRIIKIPFREKRMRLNVIILRMLVLHYVDVSDIYLRNNLEG